MRRFLFLYLLQWCFFFTTATKKNLYNVTKSKSYLDNYTSLDLKPPSIPLGELKSPFIKWKESTTNVIAVHQLVTAKDFSWAFAGSRNSPTLHAPRPCWHHSRPEETTSSDSLMSLLSAAASTWPPSDTPHQYSPRETWQKDVSSFCFGRNVLFFPTFCTKTGILIIAIRKIYLSKMSRMPRLPLGKRLDCCLKTGLQMFKCIRSFFSSSSSFVFSFQCSCQ